MLGNMPDECVDLVYLDPPAFASWLHEGSWSAGAGTQSPEDPWNGEVRSYLGWILGPLEDLHRVLKPTGSMFLVCDEGVGVYVRLVLDELFSQRDPGNQMVWWKANSGPMRHYTFFYRRSGSAPRRSPYYTVIHREGIDDSALVGFSFVQGWRMRQLR